MENQEINFEKHSFLVENVKYVGNVTMLPLPSLYQHKFQTGWICSFRIYFKYGEVTDIYLSKSVKNYFFESTATYNSRLEKAKQVVEKEMSAKRSKLLELLRLAGWEHCSDTLFLLNKYLAQYKSNLVFEYGTAEGNATWANIKFAKLLPFFDVCLHILRPSKEVFEINDSGAIERYFNEHELDVQEIVEMPLFKEILQANRVQWSGRRELEVVCTDIRNLSSHIERLKNTIIQLSVLPTVMKLHK